MQIKTIQHTHYHWIVIALALLVSMPSYAAHHEEGFVSLFNGENLDGWLIQGLEKENPKVEDGMLKIINWSEGGEFGWSYWAVITENEYKNFVLKFDVKMEDKKANTGILIHCPGIKGDDKRSLKIEAFKNSFEIQLADDQSEGTKLKPCGTLFTDEGAFYEAEKVVSNPIGEWNEVTIRYEDQKLSFMMNGETVYENLDLTQFDAFGNIDRGTNHIGIQHEDFFKGAWFKNIRIKPLD